ncbi:MAG: iron-sulfur cluster assembly accessory protein [Mariprofundaceae bacterium]
MTTQVEKPEIMLSEAACQRLRELLAESGRAAARLSVRPAGCSGLEYVLELVDAGQLGDLRIEGDGFVLLVDADAHDKALRGLRIDFQRDLLSSAFVYHNPNAKGECGCGQSFSV